MKIQGMPNKALEKYLALARQNSQGKRSAREWMSTHTITKEL
jgi:hypothetical protein